MKTYKILLWILILSVLISSCSQTPSESNQTSQEENISQDEMHASSLPETLPNIEDEDNTIFGKDFSQSVEIQNVSEWELQWFFAQPKTQWNYPGIVMIHEWWGLNDQIKYMAELLANEWYKVFAVDLYSEVATTQEKARELSWNVRANPDQALAKMKLATEYLKNNNITKLASLGWCFGWQQSLNLSLWEDLDATVIYYGNLIDDTEKLKNISWPVLGIFWETDTSVTVESVKKFQQALTEINVENQIVIYPWVGHAFANPTGNNFSKSETLDAWNKTLTFLKDNLQ